MAHGLCDSIRDSAGICRTPGHKSAKNIHYISVIFKTIYTLMSFQSTVKLNKFLISNSKTGIFR